MINFNVETEGFKVLDIRKKKSWLKDLVKEQGFKLGELNYIFLNDEGLHKINLEYLNHDTYTDIITFDNSEDESMIEGDIFVSVERIAENAKKFKVDFESELTRVMAHGVLHLCGFLDKKPADVKLMREMEDKYVTKYGEF
ncbi:rRNA maturation RNase YbeY [Lacihabitans soyangensis]|uniref:Endoribonuclease YbeY n=1 Tax=Lacihabitans soyangensis TaxID=869394 RepID=A0AAE3H3L2_9BACT|nr:rRNA maturation RNase YbeY [Lacihabitans soyangensis]MCP9764509.1 rRNA maturation RNase YbeY [Lacihabitans soyangensis]